MSKRAATTTIGSSNVKNVTTAEFQSDVLVAYMVGSTTDPTSTTAMVSPTNNVIIPSNAIYLHLVYILSVIKSVVIIISPVTLILNAVQ